MKTRLITLGVLLVISIILYASEDPSETTGYDQKKQELDQLAQRFKAETGFTGDINPNGAFTHLAGFRGKFNDISFSAFSDTTAFRLACDKIIDKLLPYTFATRKQLFKGRIVRSSSKYETEYYQSVNGYKVESGGLILIIYDVGRYRFSISNGTVELPGENSESIISEEEAEHIALSDKNDSRYQKAWVKSVFYSNIGSDTYYLAYLTIVGDETNPILGDYVYYINASNGKFMLKRPVSYIHDDVSIQTKG